MAPTLVTLSDELSSVLLNCDDAIDYVESLHESSAESDHDCSDDKVDYCSKDYTDVYSDFEE